MEKKNATEKKNAKVTKVIATVTAKPVETKPAEKPVEKAIASKTPEKAKPASNKTPMVGKSQFGRRLGSLAARLDEMFLCGKLTQQAMVNEMVSKWNRPENTAKAHFKAHANYLYNKFGMQTMTDDKGIVTLQKKA